MSESTKSHYGDNDVERILFSEDDIQTCVKEMGARITEDYAQVAYDKTPDGLPSVLVLSVLRGAAIFMTDLVRAIDLPLETEYMVVSSYGAGTTSSGVVRILKDITSSVEGRHVIIAEDVLDSGLTLKSLIRIIESRNPASVKVAAMIRKENPKQADIELAYTGFECPNEFIVGYGLDYAENYRNLPYIGVLKPEVYQGK
ncbi:Hypoxanthine-guanine phosphoribosyltransferase [Slackia heliotrinireducens]|uniref:Hypoxanthine phosphoribosyltransferase n=1 Tax=Slackia heliotrinireducens (strain ATCC 29202 / DSM 20476 / NCTC 11029 / RHS 1) TaxID=471855 RepID=C7N1I0_SLAHD|nr:hypoxanthine phosphoribosyltransferase [Slackia heliotrinireducens]ACV21272.1 hypoxanthine phosphoribosyltransferase [Slackia heliotrinireducens DSM 20476]VEG98707.1 Hypoxanthine-guanine phosphoribosyltransferase [Slackia heliotrinireducens]